MTVGEVIGIIYQRCIVRCPSMAGNDMVKGAFGSFNTSRVRRGTYEPPASVEHQIVNADHSMLSPAAMLGIVDCIADCVWPDVPQPTECPAHRKSDRRHAQSTTGSELAIDTGESLFRIDNNADFQ